MVPIPCTFFSFLAPLFQPKLVYSVIKLLLFKSFHNSYQDLWGESAATSGSQCTTVNSLSGSTLNWSTSWTWAGGSSSVKSYANAALTFTPKQLSAIKSIPIVWDWSYTGSNIVADVSFDMFTSSTSTGSSQYEIMVWVSSFFHLGICFGANSLCGWMAMES